MQETISGVHSECYINIAHMRSSTHPTQALKYQQILINKHPHMINQKED